MTGTQKFFAILFTLVIVLGISKEVTKANARATEKVIMKDTGIMQNYRNFQEVANEKRIPFLTNEAALAVPEIKAILTERDTMLAKKYPGCTMTYMAAIGTPSAGFTPISVKCQGGLW